MKILSNKQIEEILLRITANEIIAVKSVHELEDWKQHIDNAFEIAYIIGSIDGVVKVKQSIERYLVKEV